MKRTSDFNLYDLNFSKLAVHSSDEDMEDVQSLMAKMYLGNGEQHQDSGSNHSRGACGKGGNHFPTSAAAPDPLDDHHLQSGGFDHQEWKQQKEPRPQTKGKKKRSQLRTNFTQAQQQGLEKALQDHQYPKLYSRDETAKRRDMTEARAQIWLRNRKAKCMRRHRVFMLPKLCPTAVPTERVILDGSVENASSVLEPGWRCVPKVPQQVWLPRQTEPYQVPRLPVPPRPPMPLLPPGSPFPPGPPSLPGPPSHSRQSSPRGPPFLPVPPGPPIPGIEQESLFGLHTMNLAWSPVIKHIPSSDL